MSPDSVCAVRRATRSYLNALMSVRVKVSEKRFASLIVESGRRETLCEDMRAVYKGDYIAERVDVLSKLDL